MVFWKMSHISRQEPLRPSATMLHGAVRDPGRQQSIVILEIAAMKERGLEQRGQFGEKNQDMVTERYCPPDLLWEQVLSGALSMRRRS